MGGREWPKIEEFSSLNKSRKKKQPAGGLQVPGFFLDDAHGYQCKLIYYIVLSLKFFLSAAKNSVMEKK